MKLLISLVLVSLCLVLSGCSPSYNKTVSKNTVTARNSTTSSNKTTAKNSDVAFVTNSSELSTRWNSKDGFYKCFDRSVKAGLTALEIDFFNYKNLKARPLCNKEGCPHNSEGCDARFTDRTFQMKYKSVFSLDDKVYAIINSTVLSMNKDGTNHKELMRLPDSDYNTYSFLVGDKVYYEAFTTNSSDDKYTINLDSKNGTRATLCCIDVKNNTYDEVYNFRTYGNLRPIGIIGNKIYYFYKEAESLDYDTPESQAEVLNDLETKIISVNLTDKTIKQLFDGKAYEFDNAALKGKYIYYQNRKDGTIVQYNPESEAKKILVKNVKTYIKFPNYDVVDNKLFYQIDNELVNYFTDDKKSDVLCYIDTITLKNTVVNYAPETNMKKQVRLSEICAETPDLFIIRTKEMLLKDNSCYYNYGLISKIDFFNNNFSKITQIEANDLGGIYSK